MGRHKIEMVSIASSDGYKTKVRAMMKIGGRRSAKTGSRRGRTPGDVRGVERGGRYENISASPDGLRENNGCDFG